MFADVIDNRRAQNADKRQQVRAGQHAPSMLSFGPVLQQRANRHDEKPTKEAERSQQNQNSGERQARESKQKSKSRDSRSAQRNQPVFDFAARKIPGGQAAQADTDRNRCLQQTPARRGNGQHIAPIKDDVKLQQRSKKEKVCVSRDSEPQHAIFRGYVPHSSTDRPEN